MLLCSCCELKPRSNRSKAIKRCTDMKLYMSDHMYSPVEVSHKVNFKILVENKSKDSTRYNGKIANNYPSHELYWELTSVKGSVPPNSKRIIYINTSPLKGFNSIKLGETPNLFFVDDKGQTCQIIETDDYIQFNRRDTIIRSKYNTYPYLN